MSAFGSRRCRFASKHTTRVDAAPPRRRRRDALTTQVNLVAGKARNYAWASYASGSKLPVVRGKEVSAGSTDDGFS